MVQYKMYAMNVLKGDLGESIKLSGQTVNEIIARKFPYSLSWVVLQCHSHNYGHRSGNNKRA